MNFKLSAYIFTGLLLFILLPVQSSVRIPKLISNGMVLQRDTKVKVWGWASPSEKITITLNNNTYSTITNANGEWQILLNQTKAGGPYSMTIKGTNTITIKDILFGDVWLCSGQSNMELPMRRVSPIYSSDIANSTNNNIRCFTVPQQYNFKAPCTDFQSGSWQSCNPLSVLNFSAVAYFFAKHIHESYGIPIGIINASLGGSPAEAWMSETALKKYPSYFNEMQRWKNDDLIKETETSEQRNIKAWYDQLRAKDEGFTTTNAPWFSASADVSEWETMAVPGYWRNTPLNKLSGVVWFRKDITIPSSMVGKEALLILGRIVDADSVFVNGTFVGTTSYQYPPRRYTVPAGVLQNGKNTIVVRVISNSGQGGFVPDKQYALSDNTTTIDLQGEWKYRIGALMSASTPSQTFIRWKPGGLYNAMLAPLFKYNIKGALWYQGEANTDRATEYKSLLQDMISNWRNEWKEGNFPFVIAQLPNFMEAKKEPSESNWAQLRFSQYAALSLPNTALAVNIDLGEWNDIHPLNKKDVAYRMALAARKIAYKENITSSGPLYHTHKTEGNKIVITFNNCGKGLIAKGNNALNGFSIAGADGKYVWAKATISNNQVIVWNETIDHPVSVRYAWADNPTGANLYNKEGLPASPFETNK